MNKSPLISVVVPVYNTEKYIYQCIDSILKQDFINFELLLINDGSKDKSGLICDEYAKKDSRIRVYHKKNEGVSSARNLGLNNAKGEWVVFCDSDDWVEKDWLKNYANAINNETDIIFQGYICEDTHNHYIKNVVKKSHDYLENIFTLEQEDIFGWTWCKIFKKHIIQENNLRFEETLSLNEDLLFTLQYCIYASSLSIVPVAKYHYIIHPNSLMRKIPLYNEYRKKSILIKDARVLLANRYRFRGTYMEYNKWIYNRFFVDMVICLKILYRYQQCPFFSERKKLLKEINGLECHTKFLCKTDRLFVLTIKVFPNFVSDIIFRLFAQIRINI